MLARLVIEHPWGPVEDWISAPKAAIPATAAVQARIACSSPCPPQQPDAYPARRCDAKRLAIKLDRPAMVARLTTEQARADPTFPATHVPVHLLFRQQLLQVIPQPQMSLDPCK